MTQTFVPLADLRVSDRTRTTTDWTCRRERFYLTEYGGTGIVSVKGKTELDFGIDIHDALAQLAGRLGQADVVGPLARATADRIQTREAGPLGSKRARQLAAVGEGLLRGYAQAVWPTLLQLYDIVEVEPEVELRLTPWLTFMAKPDLILRSREDGTFWYYEYKTTGQRVEDWLKQWPKAVQVHSAIRAAESTLGLTISGCIIQGLAKGYERQGDQRSPFCEGWRYLGSPVTYSYTYVRNKGWEKFAPYDTEDGTAGWVAGMPQDLLLEQFPRTAPIFLNRDLCERFFSQLLSREDEIRHGVAQIKQAVDTQNFGYVQTIMDAVFPMNFAACTGRYGKYDCPMLGACWNGAIGSDPLASGLYRRREPHHAPEVNLFKAKGLHA